MRIAKKWHKKVKKGKKWYNMEIIWKISEITKYGGEITKIANNANKYQIIPKMGQKMGKKGPNF